MGVNASPECLKLCDELSFYTLSWWNDYFVHQLLVDAYAAQHATPDSRPIKTTFALVGLYVVFVRGGTGKDAQNEHIRLARLTKEWPRFLPPSSVGNVTIADALQAEPGEARDAAIRNWAGSVWKAWGKDHETVRALLARFDPKNQRRSTSPSRRRT